MSRLMLRRCKRKEVWCYPVEISHIHSLILLVLFEAELLKCDEVLFLCLPYTVHNILDGQGVIRLTVASVSKRHAGRIHLRDWCEGKMRWPVLYQYHVCCQYASCVCSACRVASVTCRRGGSQRSTHSSNLDCSRIPQLYSHSLDVQVHHAIVPQIYTSVQCVAGQSPRGKHCTTDSHLLKSRQAVPAAPHLLSAVDQTALLKTSCSEIEQKVSVGTGTECFHLADECTMPDTNDLSIARYSY